MLRFNMGKSPMFKYYYRTISMKPIHFHHLVNIYWASATCTITGTYGELWGSYSVSRDTKHFSYLCSPLIISTSHNQAVGLCLPYSLFIDLLSVGDDKNRKCQI